jgi:hypothetical protein
MLNAIICGSLFLFSFIAYSQQTDILEIPDSHPFTELKVGDKITLYNPRPDVIAHLYVFFEERNCITCFHNLSVYTKVLNEEYSINIVGFLIGQTQEFADKYKEMNDMNLNLVGDKLHLYSNNYKVNIMPFYFIADNQGNILAMDKCGGGNLRLAHLRAVLDNIKETESLNRYNLSNLKEVSRKTVVDSLEQPISFGKNASFVQNDDKLIINDIQSNKYFIYKNDKLNSIRDLKKDVPEGYKNIFPTQIGFGNDNNTVLLTGYNFEMETTFHIYDYISNKIVYSINYNYPYPPYNIRSGVIDTESNSIFVDLFMSTFTINNEILDDTVKTIMRMDFSGNIINRFGAPNELFRKYRLNKMYKSLIDIDNNGNIYEIQQPSRDLNIYDYDGLLLDKITLDFDENYKDFAEDFIFSDNRNEEWLVFNSIVTHYRDFKVLKKTNEIAIVYAIVIFPEGVQDTNSDKLQLKMFLFICDKGGNRKYPIDFKLPDNSRFLNYEAGIITLYERTGNYLEIVKYKIEI